LKFYKYKKCGNCSIVLCTSIREVNVSAVELNNEGWGDVEIDYSFEKIVIQNTKGKTAEA